MSDFEKPADNVVAIRLECISKVQGTDGLWWVAEALPGGASEPRGIFTEFAEAEKRANELAALHGVAVERKSYSD